MTKTLYPKLVSAASTSRVFGIVMGSVLVSLGLAGVMLMSYPFWGIKEGYKVIDGTSVMYHYAMKLPFLINTPIKLIHLYDYPQKRGYTHIKNQDARDTIIGNQKLDGVCVMGDSGAGILYLPLGAFRVEASPYGDSYVPGGLKDMGKKLDRPRSEVDSALTDATKKYNKYRHAFEDRR